MPGLHSPMHVWEALIAALRDEYRVIAVDLPGQGLSDSWPRNDYSIPALDSFISEVTGALGVSQFTFAGHSMSGGMAWRYALAHPERIEALILVSAGGRSLYTHGLCCTAHARGRSKAVSRVTTIFDCGYHLLTLRTKPYSTGIDN